MRVMIAALSNKIISSMKNPTPNNRVLTVYLLIFRSHLKISYKKILLN